MGGAAQERDVERTGAAGPCVDRGEGRSTTPPIADHAVLTPGAAAERGGSAQQAGVGQVLAMQRLAGNAAASRLVSGSGVRAMPRRRPSGPSAPGRAAPAPDGREVATPDLVAPEGSAGGPVAEGTVAEAAAGTAATTDTAATAATTDTAAAAGTAGAAAAATSVAEGAGAAGPAGPAGRAPRSGARYGGGGGSSARGGTEGGGPAPGVTDADQAVAEPGAGHDLITTELAEHERWAGSFGDLGTAGSDQRARHLLDMAGEGAVSGATGGAVMGFAMSAVGAAIGQVAGRRLATMAVSRGLSATPVPGLGSAIGGVMAVAGLAMRDWGATGETIGRMGTGTGYERLANDLEGLAEVLDVAMSVMDVVAGVLGGIAVGMWVGAILSAGTLSPLAASLSAIAIGMNIATTAVGLIINAIVRPVVAALRALHAFDSQGDPAQVEREGQMLSAAAGQVTGAVAGAAAAKAGGRVGGAGGDRVDAGITRIQERRTGGAPALSATTGGGPRLHVEMPDAPGPGARPDADTIPMGRPDADTIPMGRPDADTIPSPPPVGDGAGPAPSGPARAPDDFGDLAPLVRELNEDPNVAAALTDTRPDLPRRDTPWTQAEARQYANRQAAQHRAETGMVGGEVQAGHTAAARHATESGIREADWDTQGMMPLHSRRDSDVAVTVTNPDGSERTNTRHRAQEGMIDDAVGRARAGSPDGTLTPRGQLDAAAEVQWRAENTPFDQTGIDAVRGGGLAAPDAGPRVDPATGRVIPDSGGPAASSPASPTQGAAAARSAYPDNTPTLAPTPNRADAMAQYQAQVRADPGRESGVWRDADGNFHVMQGGPGSVAPPSSGRPPMELIYHSHPTTTDAAMQGLNTQPSQAGGDLSVLQYQHGRGPAGRRQTSELHFPVYDAAGNHVGFGATQFTYDPTHPLPLQVQTTSPGGRTTTQRYRSFADFQARSTVHPGGTPAQAHASFTGAESRLQHDQAAARARIEQASSDLAPSPGMVGIREGREAGRQLGEDGAASPSRAGPAYTAQVGGLRPGESMEIPINPAYQDPPGTTAELAALRERIAITRMAQQDLGRTEQQMRGQAATQRGQDAQLGQAGQLSQSLIGGGQAQQAATSQTASTNSEQQTTAGEAIDNLGRTGQEAAAVTTLVGSLRVFQGLAHLFGYLPGSLGDGARGASRDCTRLISALGRVTDADAAQGEMQGQRQGIQANEQRIGAVAQQNAATSTELTQGQQQVGELRQANQARLAETEASRAQARNERQMAATDEDQTQATHDDLLVRMQAWAGDHRAAREEAVAAARARLTGQGYEVQEAR